MSFYGTSFIFDGTSCDEFGLMMYDFDSSSQEDGTIGTKVEAKEDRLWGRYTPLDYGSSETDPLEFTLIFGVDSGERRLDRFDVAKIAGWLKKPDYRILQICQNDMEEFRYKCRIVSLEPIMIGLEIVGMKAAVRCDGPYAYWRPEIITYQCSGTKSVELHSRSNINHYYYPDLQIITSGGNVSVTNHDDEDWMFELSDLPVGNHIITCEGINGVLSADDVDPYGYFNFRFLRLVRGTNRLTLSGDFELKVFTEYPCDIGC